MAIESHNDQTTSSPVAFYFVDVFTRHALAGNPLSLVSDADGLDEHQMRAIAREFNQSETTFLLHPSLPGATWRLRSFTPTGAEVFGAGHNALGAWWWLAESGRIPPGQGIDRIFQEIGGRVLPVGVIREDRRLVAVSMDQLTPRYGETVSDRSELAASLGLAEDDLRTDHAAQVVSTGAPHLLVPVRDRAAVDRAAPDAPRLAALLRHASGQGCYLYSPDPVDADEAVAYTRFFNPTVGIWEDPATGSAAGPLVARLVALGEVPPDTTVIVEQGYALGRPSKIGVTVSGQRVRISGSAVVVADGQLKL